MRKTSPRFARFRDGDTPERTMSDKPDDKKPAKSEDQPHKVDEKVQEEAAKERAENEGYD